jgi:hypothetical protein
MLGNGQLEAMCFDGVRRLCHIRGKLKKKVDMYGLFYFDMQWPIKWFLSL